MNNIGKKFEKVLLVRMGSAIFRRVLHPRHCFPPHTLKYTEALLKNIAGVQVKLIDCLVNNMTMEGLLSETLNWPADVIVISVDIFTVEEALIYASSVKKEKNIFIVATGKEIPAELKDEVNFKGLFDAVLPGEAERAIASLIERYPLYRENETGLFLEEDLDSLPFPDYTLVELKDYRVLYPLRVYKKIICGHILSSRGCPENCIFCSSTTRASYGKKLRLRSAVNVVDEMTALMDKGANIIVFDDDNFTASVKHADAICEEIQKRRVRVKWIIHSRVDDITPGLLKKMKDAGCILLRFGVESGSRRIINLLEKTGPDINWPEKCKEAFSEAKKAGIATLAFFVVANPTETEADIEESIRLARELDPDMLQVHFFTPYPGSLSYNRFGLRIEKKNLFRMHKYIPPRHNLSMIDENMLSRIQPYFYKRFFLRPKFLFRHTVRYGLFYLYNRDVFYRLLKGARLLNRSYG